MLYDDQRGEIICSECGLVANSAMCSQEPEWRAYNAEEVKTKSRVGLQTSILNNQSLSTVIGGKTKTIHLGIRVFAGIRGIRNSGRR